MLLIIINNTQIIGQLLMIFGQLISLHYNINLGFDSTVMRFKDVDFVLKVNRCILKQGNLCFKME